MTIVPLVKISLVGVLDDKDRVLHAAQAFGALHLVPLTSAQKELEAVPEGIGRDAVEALRWLMDCPAQRHPGGGGPPRPQDVQDARRRRRGRNRPRPAPAAVARGRSA